VPAWLSTPRRLTRDAFRIFSERGGRLMSGSIAFYSMLSVVPILVIALHVATLFFDAKSVTPTLQYELARWVGEGGARTVLALATQIQSGGGSTLANLLSALTLLYASTRLFSQITTALDLLWSTPPAPRAKTFAERLVRQLERRGMAFAMVLVAGLMLIALVLFHAVMAAVRHAVGVDAAPASRAVEALGSFAVTVALFSLVFRFLPRGKVAFGDAMIGGVITATLFTLGSLAITAYVTRRDTNVYGAASSLVMLLLWVHYSAQVFFLGAAFTRAHAARAEAGDQA
jgi:membrane protein